MNFSIKYPKKAAPKKERKQDSPEKKERKRIARWLVANGWQVFEVNSGVMRTERGTFFYAYTNYSSSNVLQEPSHGGLTDLVAFKGVVAMLVETKTKGGGVKETQHQFVEQCRRLGVQQYRITTLEEAQRIARVFDNIHKIVIENQTVRTLLQSIADLEGKPKKKRVAARPAGVSVEEFLFGKPHG